MGLDIAAIRESFDRVKPHAQEFIDRFYGNLWGDYPAARALFERVDMAKQKGALLGSLVQVVTLLDKPAPLGKYLQALGARHVNYGTEDLHYEWVGKTLLKTLAAVLGDAWTPALAQQWTMAVQAIAEAMKQGAHDARSKAGLPSRPELAPPKHLPRIAVDGLTNAPKATIPVELPQAFKLKIRDAVQQAVDALIEQEIQQALSQVEKRLDANGLTALLSKSQVA
jgi:hemoglobin-like flavoprotein